MSGAHHQDDRLAHMSRTTTYAPTGTATTAASGSLSLAPFSGSWTRVQARHLVARTGFGALKRDVDRALNDGSVGAAVDRLVNEAIASPLPEAPSWYALGSSTGVNEIYDLQKSWFNDMRTIGLIEKLKDSALAQPPADTVEYQSEQDVAVGRTHHVRLLQAASPERSRQLP